MTAIDTDAGEIDYLYQSRMTAISSKAAVGKRRCNWPSSANCRHSRISCKA